MTKVLVLFLEILIALGLPIYLMGSNQFILAARPILMGVGGVYVLLVLLYYQATHREIGITRSKFIPSLRSLLIPSIFSIAIIIFILETAPIPVRLWLIGTDPLRVAHVSSRLVFYIFGSAPVQELIFRGYLTYRLQQAFTSKPWIILLSGLIFIAAHLPFKSPIMLIVSAILGVYYIMNYLKYKNLFAVTISHAFVGSVLILVRNFYLPYQ